MRKIHIIIVFIVFLLSLSGSKYACSQNSISEIERNYYLNVKQFNEFIDRFNYKTDFKGNKIDSSFQSKISRKKYLELLFNNEDSLLSSNNEDFNTAYDKLKIEFIDGVISSSYKINKYSLKIIAEAKSQIIYNHKPEKVSIFLNQEIIDNGVKWVLLSVKANFLNVLKTDTTLLRFIPPTSNETNFISLKRVFEDENYQHYYNYNGFVYDPLSVFLYTVNSGNVKFQYVNEIVYHILEIPGWKIEVKEFSRNTENSGWLIDAVHKTNNSFDEYIEKLIRY